MENGIYNLQTRISSGRNIWAANIKTAVWLLLTDYSEMREQRYYLKMDFITKTEAKQKDLQNGLSI
jgi:hypothetical protein